MPDFEVRRDDLRATRVVEGEPLAETAADGDVQLAVDRFALTANNVTYGVLGDAMSYWGFFPASEDGWGRVPVWGFGDVVASGVDGIEVGERYYGYFPMSSRVTMRAEAGGGGFTDTAEHRSGLPPFYNEYTHTPTDAPDPDETLLFRPLFGTSFLIDAFLAENDAFGAEAVVLSSASSKTAYGTAFLLSRNDQSPSVVGLTSAGNRDFVESLGVYDAVVAYDEIGEALSGDAALVFVDMAGDAAVRESVHRAAGDRLRHSAIVGATHWEQLAGGAAELPGPAPELFFAPTHLQRLRDELGGPELRRRMDDAWTAFMERVGDWLTVEHGEGPDAVEQTWLSLVDGHVDPRQGHILRL
jgi:hypothetical protein